VRRSTVGIVTSNWSVTCLRLSSSRHALLHSFFRDLSFLFMNQHANRDRNRSRIRVHATRRWLIHQIIRNIRVDLVTINYERDDSVNRQRRYTATEHTNEYCITVRYGPIYYVDRRVSGLLAGYRWCIRSYRARLLSHDCAWRWVNVCPISRINLYWFFIW